MYNMYINQKVNTVIEIVC